MAGHLFVSERYPRLNLDIDYPRFPLDRVGMWRESDERWHFWGEEVLLRGTPTVNVSLGKSAKTGDMMINGFKAAVAVAAIFAGSIASAGTVSFMNFTTYSATALGASNTYGTGFETVVVSAFTGGILTAKVTELPPSSNPSVGLYHGGLGVVARTDFVPTVVGSESLSFQLQPNVSLAGIGISKPDATSTETFRILLDGSPVVNGSTGSTFTTDFVPSSSVGANSASGSVITIVGTGTNGILVNSITLSEIVTSAVPLPAGGLLLLGALAGGAAVSRRRRKA